MSDFSITELLLLQLCLIILNAVFACAEIAVISINEIKLKKMAEDGSRRAKLLVSLTNQPEKFLATIQIGITLAGFLGSAFAADNFSDRVVNWLVVQGVTISPATLDVLAVIGITMVLSYVTLILGELVPKRIAMQYEEKIGLWMAYPIYFIAVIFSPIVWFLSLSTNLVLRLIGINPSEKNETVTEEEIKTMVDAGTQSGTIDSSEKELIHNIFDFDDKQVDEIMTHRMQMHLLNAEESFVKWEEEMVKTRYSVYPVFKDNKNNIIGTLSLKDYLKYKNQDKSVILKNAIKPVQFIPKSMRINDLFLQMQKNRNHFAIAVDEYGGISGMITMNDLLEELVGELENDETAPVSSPFICKTADDCWIIRGDTPLEKVIKCLKIDVPERQYDTFAGFLLSLTKSVPGDEEKIELRYQNLYIKILKTKEHKIEAALVYLENNEKEAKEIQKNNYKKEK